MRNLRIFWFLCLGSLGTAASTKKMVKWKSIEKSPKRFRAVNHSDRFRRRVRRAHFYFLFHSRLSSTRKEVVLSIVSTNLLCAYGIRSSSRLHAIDENANRTIFVVLKHNTHYSFFSSLVYLSIEFNFRGSQLAGLMKCRLASARARSFAIHCPSHYRH